MTLEKGASDWPEHRGKYYLDTTTKPKYEDADRRAPWIKMAAEMPLLSSYVFSQLNEADALVKAIHECGFRAKTESILGELTQTLAGIRVFKLDNEVKS